MEKETAAKIREYAMPCIVIIGVYIGFKYLSPLAAPFLFAFAFVTMLHPVLEKEFWPREFFCFFVLRPGWGFGV